MGEGVFVEPSSQLKPIRKLRNQRFEINAVNFGKPVTGEIQDSLRLLKRYVAEKRLVSTTNRFHVDE